MAKTETQGQLIKTPAGNQYFATFAGSLGGVKYYECKDIVTGQNVGFVASIVPGKFGPLCADYLVAGLRARNIFDVTVPCWTKILLLRQR